MGGRKLLGFGRHASSPPLLFIELLLPPPLGGWRAMPCLPRCGGGCLFLPLRERRMPFLIAPGALRLRCSAGLGKRRVRDAEMYK